ncbi:MAG: tocopherol cyclase family protein [Bacteroidetes bacterium]|nr:tocopherol cyclase family protein [Bacteroidota bacterium]
MADRNSYMLKGKLACKGYDWWWHSLLAVDPATGEIHPFYIEYYVINPGLAQSAPVLGQLPDNRKNGIRPCYAMIKAGKWGKEKSQLHNFYSIQDFRASATEMNIAIGSNTANEKRIKGSVKISRQEATDHPEWMTDAGEMSWDLEIRKKIPYSVGYGASTLFRMFHVFEMYWHVGGLITEYAGWIDYNGKRYMVKPELGLGYQDKNWGKDYTNPWIWLNCSRFFSDSGQLLSDTALTLGGGNPKVWGISVGKKILVAFYYENKIYEFNFSKIFFQNQKWNCRMDDKFVWWDVEVTNRRYKLELDFKCPVDTMIKVQYENPMGENNHKNLWNGGFASGTIRLSRLQSKQNPLIVQLRGEYGGCEFGEY